MDSTAGIVATLSFGIISFLMTCAAMGTLILAAFPKG